MRGQEDGRVAEIRRPLPQANAKAEWVQGTKGLSRERASPQFVGWKHHILSGMMRARDGFVVCFGCGDAQEA